MYIMQNIKIRSEMNGARIARQGYFNARKSLEREGN